MSLKDVFKKRLLKMSYKTNYDNLPSNSFTASANASIDSISKWFVGSSNKSIWGLAIEIEVNTTLAFWPPESFIIGTK